MHSGIKIVMDDYCFLRVNPAGHFGFCEVTVLVTVPLTQVIDLFFDVAEPPILLVVVP
jgi:hypothetical protein